MAFVILDKEIQSTKSDTVEDCRTTMEIFHFMFHKIFEANERNRIKAKLKSSKSTLLRSQTMQGLKQAKEKRKLIGSEKLKKKQNITSQKEEIKLL